MKKCILFIFLLIFLKKKINSSICPSKNYDNVKCGLLDLTCHYHKNNCQSKNCKDCKVCFGIITCENCYSDYLLDNTNKICYLKDQGQDIYKPEDKIICHPNCLECSSSITNVSMNCISCKPNFYKINGTNNCFDNDLLDEGYYIKDNFF